MGGKFPHRRADFKSGCVPVSNLESDERRMKFWQLVSIFRNDPSALEAFVEERGQPFPGWLRDFNHHVKAQNRAILDAELSERFCLEALGVSALKFEVKDGYLQQYDGRNPATNWLSAPEAFEAYGANAIGEVLERGSYPISGSPNHET